jgi:hypothetical protein
MPAPTMPYLPPGHMLVQERERVDWKRFLPVADPLIRIVGQFLIKPPTLLNGQPAGPANMPTNADVYNHISDVASYDRATGFLADGALLVRELLEAISR